MGMLKNRAGQPALPFELRDSEGRLFTLNDFAGRWLLLIFHRHLG